MRQPLVIFGRQRQAVGLLAVATQHDHAGPGLAREAPVRVAHDLVRPAGPQLQSLYQQRIERGGHIAPDRQRGGQLVEPGGAIVGLINQLLDPLGELLAAALPLVRLGNGRQAQIARGGYAKILGQCCRHLGPARRGYIGIAQGQVIAQENHTVALDDEIGQWMNGLLGWIGHRDLPRAGRAGEKSPSPLLRLDRVTHRAAAPLPRQLARPRDLVGAQVIGQRMAGEDLQVRE